MYVSDTSRPDKRFCLYSVSSNVEGDQDQKSKTYLKDGVQIVDTIYQHGLLRNAKLR